MPHTVAISPEPVPRARRVGLVASLCLAILATSLAPAASAHGPNSIFDRTWGKDVDNDAVGTGPEVCTVAAGCKQAGNPSAQGGEFKQPRAVATDAAGNVYVADSENYRIQKFDSAGNFLRAWGRDVDGNVAGTGFEICTVAANCKQGNPSDGQGGTLTGGIHGVTVDAAGDVYVADQGYHRIQKFDSSGNFLRTWGEDVDSTTAFAGFEICTVVASCKNGFPGTAGGSMGGDLSVASDSSGGIYVADGGRRRVQKFDSSGNFLRAWGRDVDSIDPGTGFEICTVAANCTSGESSGGLGGTFDGLRSLAADASGNVYTAEITNRRIQKFDSAGNFERAWGRDVDMASGSGFETCIVAANCKAGAGGTGLGGELTGPNGVGVDTQGHVFTTEGGAPRVQRFDSAGNFERAWGKDVDVAPGSGFEICTVAANCLGGSSASALGGEFGGNEGVAADAAGSVYVVDFSYQRIQKFSAPGNRTLTVTTSGTGAGTVTGPGIDCGGGPAHTDCSETVADGTTITLTATPAVGSTFSGFAGGGCGASPCAVAMGADRTVDAGFLADTAPATPPVVPSVDPAPFVPAPVIPAQPQPQTPPAPACKDRKPPITTLKKATVKLAANGKRVDLNGTSVDHRDCPSGVAKVEVSLARVEGLTGVNCRFIRRPDQYQLTGRKNCRKPTLFRATGTGSWTFTFPVKLKPGLYRVQARGTDSAKNKETPNKKRNIVFFSVRK